MSAESDKLRSSFADQLSSFDDRLGDKTDELKMLADIKDGIGRLLEASGGNEAEIRRLLQERYEAKALRKETFQLVKSMLDRYVTEQVPTSTDTGIAPPLKPSKVPPLPAPPVQAVPNVPEPANDDPFTRTDVIGTDTVEAQDPDARVQVGSVLRDRFMLQERVSGGSMGVVYKALDRRLAEAGSQEPWVAIKVLSPQLAQNGNALRALQQEAAKSRCLTHPNIVRFIDFDRDDDLYFLVMEWLDGRTLADILDSPDSRSIDHGAAFKIVRQIGKALAYAHRCGIVHADVKPGNIMMLPNGDAKLFDFGVARVRQRADDKAFDPAVLGALTPAYSSMQVLTGEDPVPADDVFSLACLLYRLIAGYRVFGPRNAAEAAEAGMKPQRLTGVSDAQWSAVKKALSYARVARFESMPEFIDALGGRSEPGVTLDVSHHVEFEDGGGSTKWVVGLIVLLSLLGFAGYQFGLVDELLARLDLAPPGTTVLAPMADDEIVAAEPVDTPMAMPEEILPQASGDVAVAEATPLQAPDGNPADSSESAPTTLAQPARAEPTAADTSAATPETVTGAASALPVVAEQSLADVTVPIRHGFARVERSTVTLRENSRPVIVDFVRQPPFDAPLALRLEEVGFSGNRSPWLSGQFQISDAGRVEFAPGQETARTTLSMADDQQREADQQATLRLREADAAAIELATIEVILEDDDQRQFEARLPANTIAFATSQISVRERDPAVQIDLVRFNPDKTRMVVNFTVHDVTATAGEDYFPPSIRTVAFGPGQRAARVLIPLVRDSSYEGDEAFLVELAPEYQFPDDGVYHRVAVMIRDEDSR